MGPTYALKDGVKGREIFQIYVHCSDTTDGSAADIDREHKARGWTGIGYHYVVTQAGEIEVGRPEWQMGAHVKGHNRFSLGVCLIGKNGLFTVPQMRASTQLVKELCNKYLISYYDIMGHYQVDDSKTCPGFDIEEFRGLVRRE